MMVREIRRVILLLGPVLLLLYTISKFYYSHGEGGGLTTHDLVKQALEKSDAGEFAQFEEVQRGGGDTKPIPELKKEDKEEAGNNGEEEVSLPETPLAEALLPEDEKPLPKDGGKEAAGDASSPQAEHNSSGFGLTTHDEIFSHSTPDGKFFAIDFGDRRGINPNILPHPVLDDTYLVIARRWYDEDKKPAYKVSEIVCNAVFQEDGMLRCSETPVTLPIAPTAGDLCEGDMDVLNLSLGPHDARAFWGPKHPYIIYGSNSRHICLGQFAQDLRVVVDDWPIEGFLEDFRIATELRRPQPWGPVEKNWFLFWDDEGRTYVHYDMAPKRAFSLLAEDGSVSQDLALRSANRDEKCLSKHLPPSISKDDTMHQATNALLITLCDSSKACAANDDNTFFFTIVQHKTYRDFHAVYEPYVVAFRRRSPFEIHGISRRPLWIRGRERSLDMFYVTSMSWRSRELRHHGYLDDDLFLAFGVEDDRSGGIDIKARDIVSNLELC